MEKIGWTDRVRNEVLESRRRGISYVLYSKKEERINGLVTYAKKLPSERR
jgi:hypothetical protein